MSEHRTPQIGDVVPDDSETNHRAKKRESTKSQLEAAYTAYQNREHLSERNLLSLTRDFLYKKLYGLEIDAGFKSLGTSETVEDWVQEALLSVWEAVQRGGISSYYGLVNRAAFTRGASAKKYLVKQRKTKVKLEGKPGRDSYTGEAESDALEENIDIYTRAVGWNPPDEWFVDLPDDLEGYDRSIVFIMIGGKSQMQAAEILGISLSTVEKRMAAMRKRYAVQRAEDKTRIQRERSERDDWYRSQLEKRYRRVSKSAPVPMIDTAEDGVAA